MFSVEHYQQTQHSNNSLAAVLNWKLAKSNKISTQSQLCSNISSPLRLVPLFAIIFSCCICPLSILFYSLFSCFILHVHRYFICDVSTEILSSNDFRCVQYNTGRAHRKLREKSKCKMKFKPTNQLAIRRAISSIEPFDFFFFVLFRFIFILFFFIIIWMLHFTYYV